MTKKELKTEVRALFADMKPETRGSLLADLLGEWCPCCGGAVGEDGECCE